MVNNLVTLLVIFLYTSVHFICLLMPALFCLSSSPETHVFYDRHFYSLILNRHFLMSLNFIFLLRVLKRAVEKST